MQLGVRVHIYTRTGLGWHGFMEFLVEDQWTGRELQGGMGGGGRGVMVRLAEKLTQKLPAKLAPKLENL